MNKSILLKGGTLTLVDKKLPARVCRTYLHPTSRICTAVLNVMGTELYLVNVYAPSGKNKAQEREHLFQVELMYQLIANTDNIIMCGDWNSVLSTTDTTKPTNACYSNNLKRILTTFNFKDIFNSNKKKQEYTYYRKTMLPGSTEYISISYFPALKMYLHIQQPSLIIFVYVSA